MRHNKKASLELGINAIVILILAITMLGLGLGFLRNMFLETTQSFSDVQQGIKDQIIDDIKSSNERLAFNSYEITVKRGNSIEVFYGIRNDLATAMFKVMDDGIIDAATLEWDGKAVVTCYSAISQSGRDRIQASTADAPVINFETIPSDNIESGEIKVFLMKVTADSQSPATTYQCSMIITTEAVDGAYARKDFFVKVTT